MRLSPAQAASTLDPRPIPNNAAVSTKVATVPGQPHLELSLLFRSDCSQIPFRGPLCRLTVNLVT